MKIIVEKRNLKKKKKKIVIVKNNIAIRIAGKVSRYIDASMNRATPSQFAGSSGGRPSVDGDPTQRGIFIVQLDNFHTRPVFRDGRDVGFLIESQHLREDQLSTLPSGGASCIAVALSQHTLLCMIHKAQCSS